MGREDMWMPSYAQTGLLEREMQVQFANKPAVPPSSLDLNTLRSQASYLGQRIRQDITVHSLCLVVPQFNDLSKVG